MIYDNEALTIEQLEKKLQILYRELDNSKLTKEDKESVLAEIEELKARYF